MVVQHSSEPKVSIVRFREDIQHHFKMINYEWIDHYFQIVEDDRLVLENPRQEIIEKEGFIYFAQYNKAIVGCVALEKIDDESYELSKMGVRPDHQGKKIGKRLLFKAIEKAKDLRLKRLFLYTNPKLEKAIWLYQKNGFQEVPNDRTVIARASLKMILNL